MSIIKKYKLIFLAAILISGCKCDNYFSNSSEKYLEEKYFNIECHINPRVIQKESDKIEIALNYKELPFQKVIRSSLNILPIVYETGDTLKLISNYASIYTFESKKELTSWLNLKLMFNVDSSGIITPRVLSFIKLNKLNKCRFRPVFH